MPGCSATSRARSKGQQRRVPRSLGAVDRVEPGAARPATVGLLQHSPPGPARPQRLADRRRQPLGGYHVVGDAVDRPYGLGARTHTRYSAAWTSPSSVAVRGQPHLDASRIRQLTEITS